VHRNGNEHAGSLCVSRHQLHTSNAHTVSCHKLARSPLQLANGRDQTAVDCGRQTQATHDRQIGNNMDILHVKRVAEVLEWELQCMRPPRLLLSLHEAHEQLGQIPKIARSSKEYNSS